MNGNQRPTHKRLGSYPCYHGATSQPTHRRRDRTTEREEN
jgi:hypothetical protein